MAILPWPSIVAGGKAAAAQALVYLKRRHLLEHRCRFDVISIV